MSLALGPLLLEKVYVLEDPPEYRIRSAVQLSLNPGNEAHNQAEHAEAVRRYLRTGEAFICSNPVCRANELNPAH